MGVFDRAVRDFFRATRDLNRAKHGTFSYESRDRDVSAMKVR